MIDIRLKRAINGNIDAYQEIIEEMKVYMYSIAIRFLKDDFDAADAISNTIIISYEKLKELRKLEFFKTWITRILINECKKILLSKNKTVLIDDYEETLEAKETDVEISIDLKNYLEKIPKSQKSVILMYYYEDMSIEEISEVLQIPMRNSKIQIIYCKKQFKKSNGKEGSELVWIKMKKKFMNL